MQIQPRTTMPSVVLTVDDHPLIRSALREVLLAMAGHIELLEASDPEEGLAALARRPDIDLVFLDLHFSRHDGLAYLARFRAAAPAVPVIVYTMREDMPAARQAIAHGAVGIVPKTHSSELLQRAIELVMQGGVYLPAGVARQLAMPPSAAPAAPAAATAAGGRLAAMNQQQWRILQLLAEGLPNKEIARRLGLASSTVKNQLTVVFDRLGVSNRTQAAIAARAIVGAAAARPPR